MARKFLDYDGLLYYHSKIKLDLDDKVDKETGKGLSTNDYTTLEKTKLAGIQEGAEVNVQSDWEEADTSSDAFILNKPTIPTNNNQLTNGMGYQTESQVNDLIADALEGITGIDFQVVQTLPQTGVKGVIYLLANSGSGTNSYDEYIYLTDSTTWEKIGTTDVDLTGYMRESDMIPITNLEIDSITSQ